MRRSTVVAILLAALTREALAVSVAEVAGKCGCDAQVCCGGVGYGGAKTKCLAKHRGKLQTECGLTVDRIEDSEDATLC